MSRARSLPFLWSLIGCALFASGALYRFSPSRSPGRVADYFRSVFRRKVPTHPVPSDLQPGSATPHIPPFSLPLTLEANLGQADPRVQFLARGQRVSIFLTRTGIELQPLDRPAQNSNPARLRIAFSTVDRNSIHLRKSSFPRRLQWTSNERLRAESNYFIGSNPALWHTHVPHFTRATANAVLPGVDLVAYANDAELEYDLRIAPNVNVDELRLNISGADFLQLNSTGDLLLFINGGVIRMRKPVIYQELQSREDGHLKTNGSRSPARSPIEGNYILEADKSIAFRIARRDPNATLVIDPSLAVEYSTFLGGAGEDTANSIALDSSGMVYIGGITASPSTFAEIPVKLNGPGGGSDFFVAKIDPFASGDNSLIYLTFIGGSGIEAGGMIAVDNSNNLAITGTTTSHDYPVTDASAFSAGLNDIAITELGPAGGTLVYSTLFGGNGSESTQNPGGIAFDHAGEIFIASDTTSTDLPATLGAFQLLNGGGISDGFLAIFRPTVAAPTTHLKYCTYFGINAQVGVGGVAVDAGGNAYIAGFTSDPGTTFPTLNAYQTTYAGDPADAFVIKIRPSGTGADDLAYGTFLGGAGLDKALAITVGAAMPATAYVTGTTQSKNFPMSASTGAAQTQLKGTANAFFSALGQDAATLQSSLLYSTYAGGTQSDAGLSIFFVAPNALYVTGRTTSWDFPWQNNLQPFTGNEDAFVVKFDPTLGGASSFVYATPLAGTAPPGATAVTDGKAVAASTSGQVYVAGRSTAADFPRAVSSGNGVQLICASCQEIPPAADAFLVAFQESAMLSPSVSFNALKLNFGAQAVGTQNIPPLFASVINTGSAPLNLSGIAVTGPNNTSFSLVGTDPCIGTSLPPRGACTFEVAFIPSIVGPEEAFVAIDDDAPGSPQVLSVVGVGSGPLAVPSLSNLTFANQPQGSTSSAQTVSVLNEGNQDLHLTSISIQGPDLVQFALEGDDCGSNPIPPSVACTVNVVFKPSGAAPYHAEIDAVDDSGGVPGSKQVITLSGTGTAAAPIVSVSPVALTFGIQSIATTSGSQSLTLRNLGSTVLTLTQIAITGADAASFGIVSGGTNSCPIPSGTLAIASSCLVAVDFAPQTAGPKSATLIFVDNASGSPQAISLSGSAIAPTIQLSPASLGFAPQSVGTMSASQPISLSNTGSSSLTINQITVVGANAADFSESHNCSSILGAATSCNISVTFNPSAAGNRAASILVSDDAAGNPHLIALTGTATQPVVSLSPSSLSFPNQLVGSTSATVPISVTNSGSGALLVGAISFTGANPGDFLETNTCQGTVAPSATCAINITFSPAMIGARSALLVLPDNAPNSPQTIPLSGAGTDFAILSTGATSQTVQSGATAQFQLDIQPMNGFTGPISLKCAWATSQPAGTACAFVPATLTVAANAPNPSFQVNVSTTARNQAAATASINTRLPSSITLPTPRPVGDAFKSQPAPTHSRNPVQFSDPPSEFQTLVPSMLVAEFLLMLIVAPTILRKPRRSFSENHLNLISFPTESETRPFQIRPSLSGQKPFQPQPPIPWCEYLVRPSNQPTSILKSITQRLYREQPATQRLTIITSAAVLSLALALALSLASCSASSTSSHPANSGTPPGTSTLIVSATAANSPRTITLTLTVN